MQHAILAQPHHMRVGSVLDGCLQPRTPPPPLPTRIGAGMIVVIAVIAGCEDSSYGKFSCLSGLSFLKSPALLCYLAQDVFLAKYVYR